MCAVVITSLFAVAILSFLAGSSATKLCGEQCRFQICGVAPGQVGGRKQTLRAPLTVPNAPFICERDVDDTIGFMRKIGEPVLEFTGGPDVEMSKWAPPGLKPQFDRNYILTKRNNLFKKSSITRKESKGNQEDYLAGLCVKLPILSYERIDKKSREVKEVVQTSGTQRDCVKFIVRRSNLTIEIHWDGQDDLDLELVEPDKNVINKFDRASKNGCGVIANDNVVDCSSKVKGYKEMIVGRETENCNLLRGEYRVRIRHFRNCGKGPTNWRLYIALNGKRLFLKEGTSNLDFSRVAYTMTFRI